jgi:hypothetical protein
MKRVINGKVYDTDAAQLVAAGESPYDRGNFNWWQEKLYRTRKGTWLLSGKGHALSRWRTYNGNAYGSGEGLEVLSADEALEWCEANEISADVVAAHFDVEEG